MVLSNKIIICTHLHWIKSVSSLKLTGLTYSVPWCTYRDSNQSTRPKELLVYIDLPLLVSYTLIFLFQEKWYIAHACITHSLSHKKWQISLCMFCRILLLLWWWIFLRRRSSWSARILLTIYKYPCYLIVFFKWCLFIFSLSGRLWKRLRQKLTSCNARVISVKFWLRDDSFKNLK